MISHAGEQVASSLVGLRERHVIRLGELVQQGGIREAGAVVKKSPSEGHNYSLISYKFINFIRTRRFQII